MYRAMPPAPLRVLAVAAAAVCVLLAGCGGSSAEFGDDAQAYRIDVAGSEIATLSDGGERVSDLTWSPYGDALAYAAGGRIVVRKDDGSRQTIFDDSASVDLAIDWSPGGGSIAFDSVANEDMQRVGFVSSDGAVTRVLDSFRSDRGVEHPDLSPDGTRLAYTRPPGPFHLTQPSARTPAAPQVDARPLRVFVVATSGGAPHVVPTGASANAPQWSPNGRELMFNESGRLVVRPVSGEGTRTLVEPPLTAFPAAWSPNGRRIAFISVGPGDRRSHLYIVAADGGAPSRPVPDEIQAGPAWSPDGGRIAYADPEGRIWIVRVRDASTRLLAVKPGVAMRDLEWSPTGNAIAFIGSKPRPSD
jgi:Tol biopolymer transport system component